MERYLVVGAMVCAGIGAFTDIRTNRIPNWLTYSGLVAGLALQVALGGWRGLEQGLLGALVGGGVFFLFFLLGGMGAGDVKLLAAVGAWVGTRQAVTVLIATGVAGGALALLYMVFYRSVWPTIRNLGKLLRFYLRRGIRPHPEINLAEPGRVRVPYGLAIAMGTLYLFLSTTTFWKG
jgi:prepilin peptidase CpaA